MRIFRHSEGPAHTARFLRVRALVAAFVLANVAVVLLPAAARSEHVEGAVRTLGMLCGITR